MKIRGPAVVQGCLFCDKSLSCRQYLPLVLGMLVLGTPVYLPQVLAVFVTGITLKLVQRKHKDILFEKNRRQNTFSVTASSRLFMPCQHYSRYFNDIGNIDAKVIINQITNKEHWN